jgi:hypothetical protein
MEKLKKKPNCYDCKWRGDVVGDAHSRCDHPKVKEAAKELEIKGHPHGIKSGWFMWPANFDPVWLENCNGFESNK